MEPMQRSLRTCQSMCRRAPSRPTSGPRRERCAMTMASASRDVAATRVGAVPSASRTRAPPPRVALQVTSRTMSCTTPTTASPSISRPAVTDT